MEDNEPKRWTQTEIIKLVGIIGALLAIFIYSVFAGSKNNKRIIDKNILSNPVDLLAPIKDNYELDIKKSNDEKEETVVFITDGTLKLYNISNSQEGYLIYKGKTYIANSKNYKIKEAKKIPAFINDNYANIDFYKELAKKCVVSNIVGYTFDCTMSVHDYIVEYNAFYDKTYVYDGEEQIVFHIKHGNVMSDIKVDYSKVNEIIKNGDYTTYDIRIKNVNGNDYSKLLEVYKDTLK